MYSGIDSRCDLQPQIIDHNRNHAHPSHASNPEPQPMQRRHEQEGVFYFFIVTGGRSQKSTEEADNKDQYGKQDEKSSDRQRESKNCLASPFAEVVSYHEEKDEPNGTRNNC